MQGIKEGAVGGCLELQGLRGIAAGASKGATCQKEGPGVVLGLNCRFKGLLHHSMSVKVVHIVFGNS